MAAALDIIKIKKASALESVAEYDPAALPDDAFPVSRDIRLRGLERNVRSAYDDYLRFAAQGDNASADCSLCRSLRAVGSLERKTDAPFVSVSTEYRDLVGRLYKRLELSALVSTRDGREKTPFRSYTDAKIDRGKQKMICLTDDDLRDENQLSAGIPKELFTLKACWRSVIPAKGYVRNIKKENKYDEIVHNNDPQSGGEAVYAVKSRRRGTYRHLIAALNRSAYRECFGSDASPSCGVYDILEALSLCRLPKDRQIADALRHDLAILCYQDWTKNRAQTNDAAVGDLTGGLAALRSVREDFYQTADERTCRDLIEVCLCNALGSASLRIGDTLAAYACYSAVRGKTEAAKDTRMQIQRAFAYEGLAVLSLLTGDHDSAEALCNQAKGIMMKERVRR